MKIIPPPCENIEEYAAKLKLYQALKLQPSALRYFQLAKQFEDEDPPPEIADTP